MKAKTIISSGIFAALVAILVLCRPLPVFAVSTVTILPAGDGIFSILGTGIEGASAIELAVSYDSTTLANPRVVEGPLIAGAMTATNSAVPGTVRLVIIRISPISGSGVIATLTFDRTGPSPGRISALTARLANAHGAPLLAQVLVTNPPDVVADASAASQAQNAPAGSEVPQTGASSLATPAQLPRTVIIAAQPVGTLDALHPGEHDAQPSAKDAAPAIDQVAEARTAESPIAKEPEKTQTKNIFTQKSVLERFREYQGERTADTFVSLFDQENLIGCRQDPPVAISDGKTAVKVTFISPPGNITSSDVAVMGAKLLSLRRDPDNSNTWIVKLIPEKDGYQASIAVLQGALKMVYPLTIAPKVNVDFSQSGTITKADFNRYLTKYKTAKPFSPDFTGDGKWDYRDDYILTANYLFAVKNTQQKKSKAPVSQARLM